MKFAKVVLLMSVVFGMSDAFAFTCPHALQAARDAAKAVAASKAAGQVFGNAKPAPQAPARPQQEAGAQREGRAG